MSAWNTPLGSEGDGRTGSRNHGDQVLETSTGSICDERFKAVGEVIRQAFSAEKRYVDRLRGGPISDTGSVPAGNINAWFAVGRESRRGFREFVETFPAEEWEVMNAFAVRDGGGGDDGGGAPGILK